MKNSVWIAVSFSVLASAAASANTERQATNQHQTKQESSKLIKALKLTEVPTFKGKPCIASTK